MKPVAILVSCVVLAFALSVGAFEDGGNRARSSTGRGVGHRVDYSGGRSEADTGVARESARRYFVKRVVDGDTLRLRDGERVRLIGVDTPETKHPLKPVQYFGKEASEFTKREMEGRFVALERDVTLRDKYGRLLAYVYRQPDGFFLNAELIKQGYGFAYTRFPFKRLEEFRQYEKQARREGRGLWQKEKKEEPPVVITKKAEPEATAPELEENHETPEPEIKMAAQAEEKTNVAPPPAPISATEKTKKETVAPRQNDDCKIKGNINRKKEKIYHVPGGRWYDKTKIDESGGERWFCSEEEAQNAGWRKAGQ